MHHSLFIINASFIIDHVFSSVSDSCIYSCCHFTIFLFLYMYHYRWDVNVLCICVHTMHTQGCNNLVTSVQGCYNLTTSVQGCYNLVQYNVWYTSYTPIYKVVTTWWHACCKVETIQFHGFYNLVTTLLQPCDNLVTISGYILVTT